MSKLELYDFKQYDASLTPMGRGRKGGIHVSGLVKAALKAITGTEPKAIDGEQPNVRMMMGFLWERALEYAFKEYMGAERKGIKKQVSAELDGVVGTPDGLDVKDGVLEEYKCTWRSIKKWHEDPEANFQYWFMQVKAYLHMLGLTKVRFFIFWVNGDYSFSCKVCTFEKPCERHPTGRGPQVTTEEFEFTPEELEDNWAMLLAHRPTAKEEVHVEDAVPHPVCGGSA